MAEETQGDEKVQMTSFNPLRVGKSFLQKLDELVPMANDVLEEIRALRESLGNGAWDWPKLSKRPASEEPGYD